SSTVTDYQASPPLLTLADNLPQTAGLNGTHVILGVNGVIKATSTALTTVQTEVGDNTASITQMLQSVDGTMAQYVLAGEVDGGSRGLVRSLVARLDGSVSREFSISSDRVQIADCTSHVRNAEFDRNGGPVDPSGAQDIEGWYISRG